jgi:hypothetical protein
MKKVCEQEGTVPFKIVVGSKRCSMFPFASGERVILRRNSHNPTSNVRSLIASLCGLNGAPTFYDIPGMTH